MPIRWNQMLAVGAFCGGGILDRHAKLKVAFLEGNCGWLPFLLWRLDEHWEQYGDQWAPGLQQPPSFYFKRQCYASVECDEEPVKYTIDYLGNERLVFSTDFPHVDTKYPRAVERFSNCPSTAMKTNRRFSGTTARPTTVCWGCRGNMVTLSQTHYTHPIFVWACARACPPDGQPQGVAPTSERRWYRLAAYYCWWS